MHCVVHWKSKSHPEFLCGKNGSINLELVKSLFSESEEERTREEEKETGSVERRGGVGEREVGEYTTAKQLQKLKGIQTVEAA